MIDTKILCLGFVITISGLIGLNMDVLAQDANFSNTGVNTTKENMTETLTTETEMEKATEKDITAQHNRTSLDTDMTD